MSLLIRGVAAVIRICNIRKKISYLLLLLLFAAFLLPAAVLASSGTRIIDNANLLTADQEERLQERVQKAIDRMGMDLVILTIDDADGKTSMAYADDYYDSNGYGTGTDKSGALILIDMDNRQIWVSTTGKMIEKISDRDIDTIIDSGYSDLKEGDYYSCLMKCTASLEKYGRGKYISAAEWLLSVAVAAACGAAACIAVHSAYKFKKVHDIYPYRENSTVDLPVKEDRFVNTVVTTHRIPTSNGGGGSGGGSTHMGSSGTSHGGGGRGF